MTPERFLQETRVSVERVLVVITWRDHYTTDGWKKAEELAAQEPDVNQSVGWVVAEDADRVTIVQTFGLDEDGVEHVRSSITLEKSCIESQRFL